MKLNRRQLIVLTTMVLSVVGLCIRTLVQGTYISGRISGQGITTLQRLGIIAHNYPGWYFQVVVPQWQEVIYIKEAGAWVVHDNNLTIFAVLAYVQSSGTYEAADGIKYGVKVDPRESGEVRCSVYEVDGHAEFIFEPLHVIDFDGSDVEATLAAHGNLYRFIACKLAADLRGEDWPPASLSSTLLKGGEMHGCCSTRVLAPL